MEFMVAELGIYDIESYQDFDEDIGIHDTLGDSFFDELRALPLQNQFERNNRLLDEISKDLFETELLWWVLQYYNDILDPLELDNTQMQSPSLNDIEALLLKYKVIRAASK